MSTTRNEPHRNHHPIDELDVDEYLRDCVCVDPVQIQDEYVRIPADLAYWNERYARARRAHLLAKIDHERTAARVRIEARQRLADAHDRVTESMVDAALVTDQRAQEAELVELEAEVEEVRLRGVLDALRAKREMVVSLGAHIRAEMGTDPMVRKTQRDANAFAGAGTNPFGVGPRD